MKLPIIFFCILLLTLSCSKDEIKYLVTFDYETNIKVKSDIEFLIKQRLTLKDSINYEINFDNHECNIKFYDMIDTSLIYRLLVNQAKDGIYNVIDGQASKSILSKLNDSLSNQRKNKLEKELKDLKMNPQTLSDEVNITKMEEHIESPALQEAFPVYEKLSPPRYGQSKSIGFCKISDFDSISNFLVKSQCFPQSTHFVMSNVNHGFEFRDIHAIDILSKHSMTDTLSVSFENSVRFYNNIVDASKIESNKEAITYGIIKLDVIDPEKKLIYDSLMNNQLYLEIKEIKITPVNK